MSRPLPSIVLALALAGSLFAVFRMHACAKPDTTGLSRFDKVKKRVVPRLEKELGKLGLEVGAPIFLRVFKEERVLELWVESKPGGSFKLFKTYKVCAMSGLLGPKQKEGDRQAPEGFYFVNRGRMNPQSNYHLSFDLGYPNAYDRYHKRTGAYLMIHGNCVSIGCFAMTDKFIEEIYSLADAALADGQKFFRVHSFPFRMSEERMAKIATDHKWQRFWENLKTGYDWFEKERLPPNVIERDGVYQFSAD